MFAPFAHPQLFSRNLFVFLWRSMGGFLLLVVAITITPGILHTLSGRVLRWPILLLTYAQILAELTVYIAVRGMIHALEFVFTSKKHRKLRVKIQSSEDYQAWYKACSELDESQGRNQVSRPSIFISA